MTSFSSAVMMPKRDASSQGTSSTAMVQSALLLLVEFQHLGVVHFIDMVARQDQHVLGVVAFNEVDVLVNGVGSALVPVGTSWRV